MIALEKGSFTTLTLEFIQSHVYSYSSRSTKIRICLIFPRLPYFILLLSTFLCEENMPAKNTLRIPLLTNTCKNKNLKRHKGKKQHVLKAVKIPTWFSLVLGPRWQPFGLHFNVSDSGCIQLFSVLGLMKKYLHDLVCSFFVLFLMESHNRKRTYPLWTLKDVSKVVGYKDH